MLRLINYDLKRHFWKKTLQVWSFNFLGEKVWMLRSSCVPADSDWTANVRTCSDISSNKHVHERETPSDSWFIILRKTWLVSSSLQLCCETVAGTTSPDHHERPRVARPCPRNRWRCAFLPCSPLVFGRGVAPCFSLPLKLFHSLVPDS